MAKKTTTSFTSHKLQLFIRLIKKLFLPVVYILNCIHVYYPNKKTLPLLQKGLDANPRGGALHCSPKYQQGLQSPVYSGAVPPDLAALAAAEEPEGRENLVLRFSKTAFAPGTSALAPVFTAS